MSETSGGSVPEWVVTYGDMMSLLLTFFIMLVSMSEMKEEGERRMMMDSIREAFGASAGTYGAPGRSPASSSQLGSLHSTSRRSEGGMMKASRRSSGLAGPNTTVRRINHGTVVSLGGPTLFGRHEATLNDELKVHLNMLAEVVKEKPNRLMVRGHASPEPLPAQPLFAKGFGRPIRDQMDLSYARAHAVAEYLISRGISRERILVSAAGDTEPHKVTRDKELQKLNRRVDVFLIDSYIAPARPSASEDP